MSGHVPLGGSPRADKDTPERFGSGKLWYHGTREIQFFPQMYKKWMDKRMDGRTDKPEPEILIILIKN